MTPNLRLGFGVACLAGAAGRAGPAGGRPGRSPGGLAGALCVEGELAEEFAGGGVDDPDVQVLDEEQDVGSGVGPADADVVEPAGVAEGDAAGGVDDVAADPVVGVAGPVAGGGLGPGGVDGGGGGPAGQRLVRPAGVVFAGKCVEEGLQLGDRGGLGVLGGQPLLQRLLEPLHLALGLRVVRPAVLLGG